MSSTWSKQSTWLGGKCRCTCGWVSKKASTLAVVQAEVVHDAAQFESGSGLGHQVGEELNKVSLRQSR